MLKKVVLVFSQGSISASFFRQVEDDVGIIFKILLYQVVGESVGNNDL